MIKRLLIVTAGVLLFWAAPAGAQYADSVTLETEDTTLAPGETTTFSGICEGADEVTATFAGTDLASAQVDETDAFSGVVAVTAETPADDYDLTVTCGEETATSVITVTQGATDGDDTGTDGDDTGADDTGTDDTDDVATDDTAADTDDGALARTGGSTDLLLKVAGGLVVVGGAAMLVASKRRLHTT